MDLESLKDLADRGSFRDPAGCVFRINEQIYRYIPEDKAPGIGNMLQSPWFRNLVTSGMVIPSAVVDPDESKHLNNILGEIGGKVLITSWGKSAARFCDTRKSRLSVTRTSGQRRCVWTRDC